MSNNLSKNSPQSIVGLIERLGRLMGTDAHSEGLLPVHWETLRYLKKANRFSCTHAALTAYLGLTKGTVSQSVKALAAKGLLHKKADTRDRRSSRLGLTAAGRNLIKRDPLRAWEDQVYALPVKQREGLGEMLGSLLNQRLESQGRAAFGQCRSCHYFAAQHANGKPHYCELLTVPLSQTDAGLICAEQVID